jgi:hypothetical protein
MYVCMYVCMYVRVLGMGQELWSPCTVTFKISCAYELQTWSPLKHNDWSCQ